MLKKIIKSYYKLLDEKLENWTMVVLLIAIIIVLISLFIRWDDINLITKSNILETNNSFSNNIIEVNWKQYKLIQ